MRDSVIAHTPPEDPDAPGRGAARNGWWLASSLVVVTALLAAGSVLLLGPGGGEPPAAGDTSTGPRPGAGAAAARVAADAAPAGDLPCLRDADGSSAARTPPPDVRWDVVDGMALPWSPTSGPSRRDGGLRTCYARTPAGALLAAVTLSATPHGTSAARVLREQVLPGPRRDALLARSRRHPPIAPAAGTTGDVAGFRVLEYDPERATVQVVVTFAARYLAFTVSLVWQRGDWRLTLDPPGGAVPVAHLAGLDGYTPWGAS